MADNAGSMKIYTFSVWDYAVVVAVLVLTAIVGLYHVWRAKLAKNTRQFLVANTNIGLTPLVLSMTATALSPGTMLGLPMEAYSNGVQLYIGSFAWVSSKLFSVYTIVPILYELNLSTMNQYVELRFNRFLRTVPALVGLLQSSLIIAAITYITAVVLSKATGLHIWWSIVLIMGICIIYSSLGGVSAVVWTDVLQILIIFVTFAVMLVTGIAVTGGIAAIWEKNAQGHRTTIAYFKPDPHSHYTIWSILLGNFFMSLAYASSSQSELQRQLANKTLAGARKMSMFTSLTLTATSSTAAFIGLTIYARYRNCDPLLTKEVDSRDLLAAIFAVEMFANFPGMFGLYVAAILCATLSTLSSVINSFATVILIDFVKPLIPNTSDAMSRTISKSIGILYGLLVMSLTGVSQYFGGLNQTMQAIAGTTHGPIGGILLLGIFFPWATAKGATVGYLAATAMGWWLSIGRVTVGAPYATAPMSTSECNSTKPAPLTYFGSLHSRVNFTVEDMTSSVIIPGEEPFALYLIIPSWYGMITVMTVIVVGLITSFVTGSEDLNKLDPKLISPLTKWVARSLPEVVQKKFGLAALLANDRKLSELKNVKSADGTELQTLDTECNQNATNGNYVT